MNNPILNIQNTTKMQDSSVLDLLKILVMISFFFIVMFFGTLPIRSKKFKQRPLLRAIGATFAGCLFLNVAIMHILPQAADALQSYLKDGDEDKEVFPLAYLLLMVGFIITVFFTKVLSFHSHEQDQQQQQNLDYETSDDTNNSPRKKASISQQNYNIQQKSDSKHQQQIKESLISEKQAQQNQIKNKLRKTQSSPIEDRLNSKKKTNGVINIKPVVQEHSHHEHSHHEHSHHDHSQHAHQHGHHHVLQNKSMLNQAFILTIAIYFHTIFEGIAIGVQDNITGFLGTAVAIAFHKWADALSMGCHYRNKNVSKKLSYGLILGQAILNVLAIGMGWIISSSGEVVEAIFLSISAGTFLAISTIEMLGQQLHHKQYMIIKFALLVGATAFVASIWFVENSLFGL